MDAFETVATTAVITGRTSTSSDPLNEDNINLRDDSTYSSFGSPIREGDDSSLEETQLDSPKLLMRQEGPQTIVLYENLMPTKFSTAALVAGNISRETILQAVQYYKYLTESQAHGVQPTPPPDAIKEIFDL
ncbi:hypothetical protein GQ600_24461 [Phytophthora cactorum]|nr:hypothetical protein GQ600_24461 [Phytophthora cactorum]